MTPEQGKKNRVVRELKLVVSPLLSLTNHHFIKRCFQALLLHQRRERRNLGGSLCVLASSGPASPIYTTYSPPGSLCPWNSPDKNTGVGCHFLLQGLFLAQGLNLGLLHCRQLLYLVSHREALWLLALASFNLHCPAFPPNLPQPPCGCKVKNCYPCVFSFSFIHNLPVCSYGLKFQCNFPLWEELISKPDSFADTSGHIPLTRSSACLLL